MQICVAERTLPLPAHLLRRFVSPTTRTRTGLLALLATGISLLLRRTWRPQLPRMSEAWLRSHDVDFDRYDNWREY
jgi:hypothetical protein